ncbi:cytokinin dehydrogenase 3-like [Syzygium oleosum]|uniref:cytokinin dehydrogenase 3-like n=1 Tax=Syzygium oleosum TaxID=219896 RepID=UPI0024B9390D|nr:cytokinin dehydrogenase 3-like [Syzygium oleosum]
MAETYRISSSFMVKFITSRSLSTVGKSKTPTRSLTAKLTNKLLTDPESITMASTDFGNIVQEIPLGILQPSCCEEIVDLVRAAYSDDNSSVLFPIAARGRGHSVRGQALARGGVVVDMTSLASKQGGTGGGAAIAVSWSALLGHYADVGGGQIWRDLLEETLGHGLAPVSWTDYLYLTVGGTLSNGGISGQTFRYGPQISNVHEMDVITGTEELMTCSPNENPELFYSVLGGLGQFGIITRARIALDRAPKRVKWVRMLYSDFSAFTRDQEHLISKNGRDQDNALDYVEGLLLMHQGPPDSWRSSFFPESDHLQIASLMDRHKIIYCLEVVKYYDDLTQNTVNKDLENLFQGLSHIPEFTFQKDVAYVDFLDRVREGELKLQVKDRWDVPHPWLNLFVPKSRISDFNDGVFKSIVLKRNITTGTVLIYPMNRNKWDDRMSVVVPDEDVFYFVGFLHSSGFDDWQEFDLQNKELLQFCEDAGIEVKQYLPHFGSEREWMRHFGSKWRLFQERKDQFDPKMVFAPGQKIFDSN